MNLRCLLLSILLLLLLALPTLAQEDDLTMTWLASGAATASYSPNDSDYSLALEGTHAEFTLYQDSYGMHTTFCDCPLTETLDFVNLLTFSGVA